MFDKLITAAFEKAKEDTKSEIVSQLAKHISDVLLEDYKFMVSERTLRNYYNKIKKKEEEEELTISRQISLHLSRFLGYKDFKEFIRANSGSGSQNTHTISKSNKRFKLVAISTIVALLGFLGYDNLKKDCMVWVNDSHFEKVRCEDMVEDGVVLYQEEVFENFKKINPDCNYNFFKPDGTENLWYLKGKQGDLEFFTSPGNHPKTKKTLRPITPYIIDKYICKTAP